MKPQRRAVLGGADGGEALEQLAGRGHARVVGHVERARQLGEHAEGGARGRELGQVRELERNAAAVLAQRADLGKRRDVRELRVVRDADAALGAAGERAEAVQAEQRVVLKHLEAHALARGAASVMVPPITKAAVSHAASCREREHRILEARQDHWGARRTACHRRPRGMLRGSCRCE